MHYIVENYGAPGCTVDPKPFQCGTIKQARNEVRSRLGVRLLREERRTERKGAVEAYAARLGCGPTGGVEIRRETLRKSALVKEALAGALPAREEARLKRTEKRLEQSPGSPPSRQRAATKAWERAVRVDQELADRAAVFDALGRVAKRDRQALLSVRDVRAEASIPKERFDAAILELSRRGDVVLHEHDHPGGLSEAERDQLVKMPGRSVLARERYFIGVGLRGRR